MNISKSKYSRFFRVLGLVITQICDFVASSSLNEPFFPGPTIILGIEMIELRANPSSTLENSLFATAETYPSGRVCLPPMQAGIMCSRLEGFELSMGVFE